MTDPLASASVLALMEDREGNLWAGTETGGLHILRDQRFKALTAHDGLSSDNTTTVVEDRTGALWVGTSGAGLNVVGAYPAPKLGVSTYTVRNGLPSDVILSLAASPKGDMWVGTPDGLSRIRGHAVTTFTSADGLPDDFIRSLLVDADGSLWIGTRRGLTHWLRPAREARWKPIPRAMAWAATWWAPWRAIQPAICGWLPLRGCRACTKARSPTSPPPKGFRAT